MEGKSILLVGGDAGSISQALALADAGNRVVLVAPTPGIGGEQLRAAPLNGDSPFVASQWQAARNHKNIRLISNALLEDLTRENGSIRVRVKKIAPRIIPEKCDNCMECIKVCPVHLWDEYNQSLCLRTAIDFYNQDSKTYSVVKERPVCEETCPVHLDIRGYIGLIADGKFKESLDLIRRELPFPATIGRICPHPCEEKCNRGYRDKPLCIRDLKRFVADWESRLGDDYTVPLAEPNGKKVAVIGAGPAGLACAHDLALRGYGVTVFEALPVAGGMLAVGIPKYRLPWEVLNREIAFIERLGVALQKDRRAGKDFSIEDLFSQGFGAVFIAVGCHTDQKLRVPGEEARGVVSGVDFLRDIALGNKVAVGKKVGIIGGGNVAMDAARSSLRLGANEVTIIYRRSRQEMPASSEEIDAAMHEGIRFEFLVAPEAVVAENGAVAGLQCVRMELGEPDASGRRRPVPVAGSEFALALDMIIPAIGQAADLAFLGDSGIATTRWGTIIADSNGATNRQGVFAGGDCVSGPWIAIGAIAAGKQAARSIDQYLQQQA